MREIKYQAWYNGKMYVVNMIIWYSETNIVYGLTDPKLLGSQIHVGSNEAQRREYTGLKDGNGKEIYEGDIVNYLEMNLTIAWSDTLARPILKPYTIAHHYNLNLDVAEECEVIGNIYENPELVKHDPQP